MKSIKEKTRTVLEGLTAKRPINPKDRLKADLGMDSIRITVLFIKAEEAYRIRFDNRDLIVRDSMTASDFQALIDKYCEK